METQADFPKNGGAQSDRKGGLSTKLVLSLAAILEGAIILALAIAAGIVIYNQVQIIEGKDNQITQLTSERQRLSTELADTGAKLKTASDLAAQNGEKAAKSATQVTQLNQQVSQLTEQGKQLDGKLTQTTSELESVKAEKDKYSKNYNETVKLFAGYRGIVECTGKKLTDPDYTNPETIRVALEDYFTFKVGDVDHYNKYKLFTDMQTTYYLYVTPQNAARIFIVTFESDGYLRNSVYLVNEGCFLDSGVPEP